MLRAHPAVVRNAVRFNGEADSLNACVLGPDGKPGTEEHDLFVREVVREMTAKAGQKCTAIRRAFVPREHLPEVEEALRAKLAEIAVGDPRDPETRMGPLVSAGQAADVRAAVAADRRRDRAGRGRRERLPVAGSAPPRRPDGGGGARRRGVRPGLHAAALRQRW